jgi:hypothetical protein
MTLLRERIFLRTRSLYRWTIQVLELDYSVDDAMQNSPCLVTCKEKKNEKKLAESQPEGAFLSFWLQFLGFPPV